MYLENRRKNESDRTAVAVMCGHQAIRVAILNFVGEIDGSWSIWVKHQKYIITEIAKIN